MRVDLDELERCGTDEEREDPMICVLCNVEVHDINCGLGGDMYEAPMLCCECMHGTIQKLCAELRAAREVVSRAHVLCAWNPNGDPRRWARETDGRSMSLLLLTMLDMKSRRKGG